MIKKIRQPDNTENESVAWYIKFEIIPKINEMIDAINKLGKDKNEPR